MPNYTIIIGDSRIELKKIPSGTVKCIVTSPPYNVGKAYKGYHDSIPEFQYQILLRDIFSECKRIVTDDGLIFINLADEAQNWHRSHDVMAILEKSVGLHLVHRVIWSKPYVQPLAKDKQTGFSHELIFILSKKDDSPYTFNYFEPLDVWTFYATKEAYLDHPAVFPAELPERCAKLICKQGDTMLDPFGGVGHTILAARNLGLNGIMCELSPDYLPDIKQVIKYGTSMSQEAHFKIKIGRAHV